MWKRISKLLAGTVLLSSLSLAACTNQRAALPEGLDRNEQHGIFYEIFVRAFADSNGDGIGDLNGVTQKLDYIKELGADAIWLMPIHPSPSYHGYDVTDYRGIHPDYGTLRDFKRLVQEAHKRHISVLIDLVVNHTSNEHPWFQASESYTKSGYRNYYNWSMNTAAVNRTGDWGQNAWWDVSHHYEGVFSSVMPDLNYDNEAVRKEVFDIGKFWLRDIGIDGFRLDAAKYLYSFDDEKDVAFWQQFRSQMNKIKPNAYIVGEVWDNPSVIAKFLDRALTSGFNFDLSTRLIDTVRNEKDAGLPGELEQVRRSYAERSKGTYRDSTFLTNHDIDRVMSQLGGNGNHARMAASLLLTLPGNPFIYYGEELGMEGKKPDEHIREPFVWQVDEQAPGQSKWEPNQFNADRQKVALEAQCKDENSIYHTYRKLIRARRSSEVLMKGEIRGTPYQEAGLMLFKRTWGNESMLVVHNLSGSEKQVALTEEDRVYSRIFFSTHDKNALSGNVILQPYSTIILAAG